LDTYLDPKTEAFIRYINLPGNEPSVIFLGGLGIASTAAFPRVVFESGLNKRHSILVDVFGCGYSDSPNNFSYSIEDQASTLSGLLDHVGSKQYVIVGHSLGGAIAIELASKRPDLVIQLILAEANLDAGGGMFSRSIAEQTEVDFIKSGYQELIRNCRNEAMNGDYTSSIALGLWQVTAPKALYGGAVSAVKGTQPVMWDQLIQLSIPRTYIFGSRSIENYEEDRALQRRLEKQNIHVAVVPEAGHGMMAENPEGFARVIVEALESQG
jgi:pimeloyl-ACP methyl ester carboxylesterase